MTLRDKILDKIYDIEVEEGVTKRTDCFICGKRNTFTVTKKKGKLLWNCFSASCGISGVSNSSYTKDDIVKQILTNSEEELKPFVFPEYFVEADRSKECLEYIKEFNFYEVFKRNPNYFMHDVKTNRLVFVIAHEGEVVGAVGRALEYGVKWYRYDKYHAPFILGDHSTAVVVEDCTSACVVANEVTGVALLGTTLLTEHINYLKKFKKIWVALDRDATDKALAIQRKINIHVPKCFMMILERDLKYEKEATIKKMFSNA